MTGAAPEPSHLAHLPRTAQAGYRPRPGRTLGHRSPPGRGPASRSPRVCARRGDGLGQRHQERRTRLNAPAGQGHGRCASPRQAHRRPDTRGLPLPPGWGQGQGRVGGPPDGFRAAATVAWWAHRNPAVGRSSPTPSAPRRPSGVVMSVRPQSVTARPVAQTRLRWWALALPLAAFLTLLFLTTVPAHAGDKGPPREPAPSKITDVLPYLLRDVLP